MQICRKFCQPGIAFRCSIPILTVCQLLSFCLPSTQCSLHKVVSMKFPISLPINPWEDSWMKHYISQHFLVNFFITLDCFIYILESSNSSSITFWTRQLSSSSRSNWTSFWTGIWTGIWTGNSNGSWTDKKSSYFI